MFVASVTWLDRLRQREKARHCPWTGVVGLTDTLGSPHSFNFGSFTAILDVNRDGNACPPVRRSVTVLSVVRFGDGVRDALSARVVGGSEGQIS